MRGLDEGLLVDRIAACTCPMVFRNQKLLLKNLAGLVLAPVVFLLLFRWFEYRSVFLPTKRLDATGDELGVPCKDVWITASDGVRLHGWFFSSSERGGLQRPVFLVLHGNGGNISHRLDLYDLLLFLGADVLTIDYRGYGRSEGRPTEKGTYLDAVAAYDWLMDRGVSFESVIAYGESLGGAVAAGLALKRPLGGMILQSTFTSVKDIGNDLYPWLPVRTFGSIRFDTLNKLSAIQIPLMVLHSRDDELIPFSHAERLYAESNSPKLFREISGGHNDSLYSGRALFHRNIADFLEFIEKSHQASEVTHGSK